jgi:hypothetical protein
MANAKEAVAAKARRGHLEGMASAFYQSFALRRGGREALRRKEETGCEDRVALGSQASF